ncbi:hypothetical protein ACMAZF_00690 [Psychrobium sp. nBUS_13]|uniref:hypothetical protein n=1 Tax=Psychrobium sp. nBUS_13 TaxID=3395319 RepID=UPI003EBEDCC7
MREVHQPLPRESLTCEQLCRRVASQEANAEIDTVNLLLPYLTKKLAMKADMNLVADLVQETMMALISKNARRKNTTTFRSEILRLFNC